MQFALLIYESMQGFAAPKNHGNAPYIGRGEPTTKRSWSPAYTLGELVLNGLRVLEDVQRPRRPADRTQRWMTFVRNHAKAIIASDFFVVVTATFQLVCVVVIMERMTPEPPWKSFLRRAAVITESKVNGIRGELERYANVPAVTFRQAIRSLY